MSGKIIGHVYINNEMKYICVNQYGNNLVEIKNKYHWFYIMDSSPYQRFDSIKELKEVYSEIYIDDGWD